MYFACIFGDSTPATYSWWRTVSVWGTPYWPRISSRWVSDWSSTFWINSNDSAQLPLEGCNVRFKWRYPFTRCISESNPSEYQGDVKTNSLHQYHSLSPVAGETNPENVWQQQFFCIFWKVYPHTLIFIWVTFNKWLGFFKIQDGVQDGRHSPETLFTYGHNFPHR